MKACHGVLEFENIAGLLVKSDEGFRFRCSSCKRCGVKKTAPKKGLKCSDVRAAIERAVKTIESQPREVTISRTELHEALVMYAAGKSGMKYPLRHSIKLNGSMVLMGSDADEDKFCTVTLEHLANVVPLKGKDDR